MRGTAVPRATRAGPVAGERTPLKVAGGRLGDFEGGGGSCSAGGSDGETAAGVCVPGVFAVGPLCLRDGGGSDVFGTLHPPLRLGGPRPPGLSSLSPSFPEGWHFHLVSALKRQRACAIPTPARLCLQKPLPAFCLAAGEKLRSGFPPWVRPAQPGFGSKPRWGVVVILALERAACFGTGWR